MGYTRFSVFVLALVISGSAFAVSGAGWQASFERAEQLASERQVPLLLHFHAEWCGPCRAMERDVFSSPVVQRALQDGLVAVQVNTSQRPDLKQRFGAETIPRDVVVYPDGTVETLSVGLVPQHSYLANLRDTAARGQAMLMNLMEQLEEEEPAFAGGPAFEEDPLPPVPRTQVESVPSVVEEPQQAETVGLSGYCPVMLTGKKQWVTGRAELAERYRGVIYHFSGVSQREEFLDNPDRYAPRNLGCDPVVLVNEQRAVTGKIRYGAFFDGKLYLFRTAESRREFKRSPLRYTRIQHAVKLNDLSGQTFR